METTQSGAEQHCKPQMELSQERRQQTSKMSGPRHGLCSKIHLVLALTHVWPNAWASESLKKHWKKIKQKKASGPDGITNEMLKHLGPGAKHFMLRICNQSWSTGTVPTILEKAVKRPFPKKGKDKLDPSSYCPIGLLSCVGKLLERIINKRLTWHLVSNSVLAPKEAGYRQFRSTEDQLALLTQDIEDAFQKEKILAVFFDLLKAFDKVWKEMLLLKLLRPGVHGKFYKWLSDFPFSRTARVNVDWISADKLNWEREKTQGVKMPWQDLSTLLAP